MRGGYLKIMAMGTLLLGILHNVAATDQSGIFERLRELHAWLQAQPEEASSAVDDDTLQVMYDVVSIWLEHSTQLDLEKRAQGHTMIMDIAQRLQMLHRAERISEIDPIALTVLAQEYALRDQYLRTLVVDNLIVTSSVVLPPIPNGITTLNGLTESVQYFANGYEGVQPEFNSAINTHTLNIPLASTYGVLAGLVTSTDYYNFANTYTTVGAGTALDVPLTLVRRDATGSFASTTITLTGCLIVQDNNLAVAGTLCGSTQAVTLVPQGTRAFQLSTGGNSRGINAVDLQIGAASTEVASGNYAVIAGGQSNTATGQLSFVGGGTTNTASAYGTTVVGGYKNTASSTGAVVVGGGNDGTNPPTGNQALGVASFVGGGIGNMAANNYDTVVSGSGNNASGGGAFVGGGVGNSTGAALSFVGGGYNNIAANYGAVVCGGGSAGFSTPPAGNEANGISSFVGGGVSNTASQTYASIVGGQSNTATGQLSFVGGGVTNTASAYGTTVVGGYKNTASSTGAVVVGGGNDGTNPATGNQALGVASFVGGGIGNMAANNYDTVVSGSGNNANSGGSFIGGGQNNIAGGPYTGIVGGQDNIIGAATGGGSNYSTIVGGFSNTIADYTAYSFIGSGSGNTIETTGFLPSVYSALVGGQNNTIAAGGATSFIGGGQNNMTSGQYAVVTGGSGNVASGSTAFVGGGYKNIASGPYSIVVGGGNNGANPPVGNQATSPGSFVGGGMNNLAGNGAPNIYFDTVVSGSGNIAQGGLTFVGGGYSNQVTICGSSIVGGGQYQYGASAIFAGNAITAYACSSLIGSGLSNTIGGAAGLSAIVSGTSNIINGGSGSAIGCNFIGAGANNAISGVGSAIAAGGFDGTNYKGNTINSGASFIGAGLNNTIDNNGPYSAIITGSSNTITIGIASVIAGGINNNITGNYSFAAGVAANAGYNCFVWSDGSNTTFSPANNTFTARASGGYTFYTATGNVGATLPAGASSWMVISDKKQKANFQEVDHVAVLEKVAHMPIETWNYQSQDPSIRHMGPYAQDFHEAFGLGEDPLRISTVDADGVALAAIKGMYLVYQQDIAALRQEIAELRAKMNG